jgi:hypothetical protein
MEVSIYSITEAVHYDNNTQSKPNLNLDASIISDNIGYRIDNQLFDSARVTIYDSWKNCGKDHNLIKSSFYLKRSRNNIKKIIMKMVHNNNLVKLGTQKSKCNLYKYLYKQLIIESKKFSEDLEDFNLLNFFNYLDKLDRVQTLYFIFFMDFRGRIYTISSYGPISNKFVRNILVYEKCIGVENFEFDNSQSRTFNFIKDNYFHLLDCFNIKNNSLFYKNSLFWSIIGLAQPFKNKLTSSSKVLISELLLFGVELFKNKNFDFNKLELNEIIEFKKYVIIINKIVEGGNIDCYFICKDATASVLQHLFIYLHPKNTLALQMTNILGTKY